MGVANTLHPAAATTLGLWSRLRSVRTIPGVRVILVGCLLVLGACGSRRCDSPAPSPDPPTGTPHTPDDPLPAGGTARATAIRVHNAGTQPLRLDTSFGPLSFVGAAAEDGATGALWLEGDNFCDCVCTPGARCAECEPPEDSWLAVAPGATVDVPWNGFLRRGRVGEECQERFAPPAARYVFGSCAGAPRCASTSIVLPASDPITLRFTDSTPVSFDDCDAVPAEVRRRAAGIAIRQVRASLRDDRLAACGADDVECVEPSALDARRSGVVHGECRHFVVPRGIYVEVETFVPLPPDSNGGERFSVIVDGAATHVQRVRFEQ